MAKSLFVKCLSFAALSLICGTALGARYVPVRISVNGEVILEGNASDDGHRDADAVWEALKDVKLRETEAFKKLEIASDATVYKFRLDRPENNAPLPIQIDASVGGEAATCVMTIKRVKPDGGGGTWKIDSEDLDGLFDFRLISRAQARYLKNPKFDKFEAMVKEKARSNVKK